MTQKTATEGDTLFQYSSRGALLGITRPDSSVISYDHDPFGRKIAKKIDGNIVEKYLWAGNTRLLAVYDGSNNLVMRFQYADERMPVSLVKEGVTYYLVYDQVGSLRAVVDNTGNIIKKVDYDSFGSIINDSNSAFTVPFGFAGGLHDRDTGLIRFGARDYDPAIGKWTAKDPIDFAGGDVNLFNYVENDPIKWIDPKGLDKLLFNGDSTIWLNNFNQIVHSYGAISGGFGNGALPEGYYAGDNLRRRNTRGMKCGDKGWSLDLTPAFNTDRTLLRIHPDEPPTGTLGCIGINCVDSERLYKDLNNYFNSNPLFPFIPVEVKY